MSSAGLAGPFSLELKPSRFLNVGIGVCHLLALVSLLWVELPLAITGLLGLSVFLSCLWSYLRFGMAGSRWFVDRVSCSADGAWRMNTTGRGESLVRLIDTYVHPRMVILNFAIGLFRRRAVVILTDSADAEALRRLRVRLLLRKSEQESDFR